jgi:hypothetical protein
MVLEVAKEASSANLPLNSGVGGILSILKQFEARLAHVAILYIENLRQQNASNRNDIKKLIMRIQGLFESLTENYEREK